MKKVLTLAIVFIMMVIAFTGCLENNTASLQDIALSEGDLPDGWEFLEDMSYNQTEVGPDFIEEGGLEMYIKYFKSEDSIVEIQFARFESVEAAHSYFDKYHDECANLTYEQILMDDVDIGDECFLLEDHGEKGYVFRVGDTLSGVGFEYPEDAVKLDDAALEELALLQASRMT